MKLDCGDIVLHTPTQEKWRVAYVIENRVYWLAYPLGNYSIGGGKNRAIGGFGELKDCTLIKKASPTERKNFLFDLSYSKHPDDMGVTELVRKRLRDKYEDGGYY